jgi:hypothetical protein
METIGTPVEGYEPGAGLVENLRRLGDFQIPGANPEVQTPMDAIVGMLVAGAGPAKALGQTAGGGMRPQKAPAGRVYHGTRSNEPLNMEKPGLHVGTREASLDRVMGLMGNIRRGKTLAPRTEMFDFSPKKTAKIADLGAAMTGPTQAKGRALMKAGYITKAEHKKLFLDKSNTNNEELYSILRKKGYDAIEYTNRGEGPGGKSYEVLNMDLLKDPIHGQDPNLGNVIADAETDSTVYLAKKTERTSI